MYSVGRLDSPRPIHKGRRRLITSSHIKPNEIRVLFDPGGLGDAMFVSIDDLVSEPVLKSQENVIEDDCCVLIDNNVL